MPYSTCQHTPHNDKVIWLRKAFIYYVRQPREWTSTVQGCWATLGDIMWVMMRQHISGLQAQPRDRHTLTITWHDLGERETHPSLLAPSLSHPSLPHLTTGVNIVSQCGLALNLNVQCGIKCVYPLHRTTNASEAMKRFLCKAIKRKTCLTLATIT